jgi:hypothetical protein
MDEMVEEDMEPGEDEGEFSGDGGTGPVRFVWIRSNKGCSPSLGEKLKVVVSAGRWNIGGLKGKML